MTPCRNLALKLFIITVTLNFTEKKKRNLENTSNLMLFSNEKNNSKDYKCIETFDLYEVSIRNFLNHFVFHNFKNVSLTIFPFQMEDDVLIPQ